MTSEVAGLLAFRGEPYLVLSLYIDVDARQQELSAVRSRSHSLLHQAREELTHRGEALEHAIREAALDDLERCRAFLDDYLPRGACRGWRNWARRATLSTTQSQRTAWDNAARRTPCRERIAA